MEQSTWLRRLMLQLRSLCKGHHHAPAAQVTHLSPHHPRPHPRHHHCPESRHHCQQHHQQALRPPWHQPCHPAPARLTLCPGCPGCRSRSRRRPLQVQQQQRPGSINTYHDCSQMLNDHGCLSSFTAVQGAMLFTVVGTCAELVRRGDA